MDEPKRMYSCVRDKDGDVWMRGRTRWSNLDGPGKLPWYWLEHEYGPLSVDASTERMEERYQAAHRERVRSSRRSKGS